MKTLKCFYLLPIVLLFAACSKEPEACFSVSNQGMTYDFDGSCSLEASSFEWEFGDGGTSIAESPSHTYTAGGTYDVTLRVGTQKGKTSTITKTVTVQCPEGFSGQNCSTAAHSIIFGSYSLSEVCSPSGPAGPYSITINASTPPFAVNMIGIWETGTASVQAIISSDGTTFQIARQLLSNGFEIACNNGSINTDGSTLNMPYFIYASGGATPVDQCVASLVRQ